MSIFKKKKLKKRRRDPELKRSLFRPRKIARGPKIYLPHKKTVRFEYYSTFWLKVYFFLFLFSLGAFLYLIFFSSLFKIEKFVLLGGDEEINKKIEREIKKELEKKILFFLPSNHYLFINSQHLSSLIKDKFPEIKAVKLKRKFPNLLKINFQLKEFQFTWVEGDLEFISTETKLKERLKQLEKENPQSSSQKECDKEDCKDFITNPITDREEILKRIEEVEKKKQQIKYFLMDREGELGKKINSEEVTLPLLCDRSAQEVRPNMKPLSDKYFSFISEIFTTFPVQTNLQINFICIPSKEGQEIYLETKKGIGIFFNTALPLNRQLSFVNEAFKQAQKEKEEIKEYIDLRIEGKIYYK